MTLCPPWPPAVEVSIFRYGGDEISVNIKGSLVDISEFGQQLALLNGQGETVAPMGNVSKYYVPERVRYNPGSTTYEKAKEVLAKLVEVIIKVSAKKIVFI